LKNDQIRYNHPEIRNNPPIGVTTPIALKSIKVRVFVAKNKLNQKSRKLLYQ